MVARENRHVFGIISVDKVYVLINSVCGALVPLRALYLLIRRENMNSSLRSVEIPRLTVADIVVKLKRLILGQNTDGRNAGIHTV